MNWTTLQQRWQAEHTPAPALDLDALIKQTEALSRTVGRRDLWENLASVFCVLAFGYWAWKAFSAGEFLQSAFAGFTMLCGVWIPLQLWWARRQLPSKANPGLSTRRYLQQCRDAMISQATMQRTAAGWCLGPLTVGAIGILYAILGLTAFFWIFTSIIVIFDGCVIWLNHRTARMTFEPQAERINQMLRSMAAGTDDARMKP